MDEPTRASQRARVAIVVLNWNGADDTLRCLRSLRSVTTPADVIVVDNGSTDGSVEAIAAQHPWVTLLALEDNVGYTGGNNAGLREALASGHEIVGVLNNDTVVTTGFLSPLIAAIDADPGRIVVSPVIRYLDDDHIWFAGSELDTDRGIYVHRTCGETPIGIVDTPALTGCALFAHRDVWAAVGSFDDTYFLVFEDADWSRRAVDHGARLVVVGDSIIRHAVSASFAEQGSIATYYYVRNGMRLQRAQGRPAAQRLRFLMYCLRATIASASCSPSAARRSSVFLARGIWDGLRNHGGRYRA